jgi:uncharacterized protein
MTLPDHALEQAVHDIADCFFDAVADGDMKTVRDIYTEDAQIWHNFDNATQTRDENLQLLDWVSQNWRNFRFENVRRRIVDGGFVQQHTMRGEGPDGTPFEAPAILLVQVNENCFITRIEEYFHPGQVPLPG